MDDHVRFHHVSPDLRVLEVHGCARHWTLFHETYTIALMGRARSGFVDWRYRHHSYVVGSENLVMAIQPGELHTTFRQTPPWDFIALQASDALMKSIAAELGWRHPELNVELLAAGATRPPMVRALCSFRATLCTTLFADLANPGAPWACTCWQSPGAIFEALTDVVRAFIEGYVEGARQISVPERGAAVLRRAKDYLHDRYKEPYSLEQLARESGCGKYYLAHAFKREFGLSPSQYRSRILVSKACELLTRFPEWPLDWIAQEVGWPSQSAAKSDRATVMIRHFRRALGMTPNVFRGASRESHGAWRTPEPSAGAFANTK